MRKKAIITLLLSAIYATAFANEGMWILPNIPDSISTAMSDMGMDIDIDDIYSNDNASLKDASVYLTSGYSGTIISKKGLLIAPYKAIEKALPDTINTEDGFESNSIFREVPMSGIGAWILKSTKDVSYRIAPAIQKLTNNSEIKAVIDSVSSKICQEEIIPKGYKATVSATSTGNYYLYIYKCFQDVRLVYMPPSSIVNDKLRKERHAADFVILRIYASRDNAPAQFDKTNKPYTPDFAAVISKNAYKEGNFVFSLGFPNMSSRQILASELTEKNITKPTAQLKVLNYIDSIGYKNFHKTIFAKENEINNLLKNNVIEMKKEEEHDFTVWAANNKSFFLVLRYANLISKLNKIYSERKGFVEVYEYLNALSINVNTLNAANLMLEMNYDNEDDIFDWLNTYFVDFNEYNERLMLWRTLDFIETEVDSALAAPVFAVEKKKYKGNRAKYIDAIFSKSLLTDDKRYMKYLDKPTDAALQADMLVSLVNEINKVRKAYYILSIKDNDEISRLSRLYKEGSGIENPQLQLTPDANYSLRMSYGKIAGYSPDDVTNINYFATLSGMFNHSYLYQKSEADRLLSDLYESLPHSHKLNTSFMTDCDMAAGRMGYGVYDFNGELLGIATSTNLEALDNLYLYNGKYQRLNVLDINYVMFILQHYSKVLYILQELEFGEVEKAVSIQSVEQ
ncbi:MAG: S46 family peptidase [Paludibacteraceae bacterium]|nr:S46 family peptidase [Paludibacteraceae bacterium]